MRWIPILLASVLLNVPALAQPDPRPIHEQPHHGLLVRDHAESGGMVVGWILPGPLGGRGFVSEHVNRGDLIAAVNDEPTDRAAFNELMRTWNPGDTITLSVIRTGGDPGTAVAAPGAGTDLREIALTLASRAEWSGPIAFPPRDDSPFDPESVVPGSPEPTALESFLFEHLESEEAREPIDDLLTYLQSIQESSVGFNTLSRVRYGFHRPTRLAELQQRITDPLPEVVGDPPILLLEAADNLDLPRPRLGPNHSLAIPQQAVDEAGERLRRASSNVDRAFAALDDETRAMLPQTLIDLTETVADHTYIHGHPDAQRLIRGLRASMEVDFAALLQAAADLSGYMLPTQGPQRDTPTVALPDALCEAVKGDILAYAEIDGHWIVYGGFGPNEYDMSKLAVVFDAGGDDIYRYPSVPRPPVQLVVDLAGNDRYLGEPASANMGVSIIVDHAGNDLYVGSARSGGVGLMGVGIIVDGGGADIYTGTKWSLGAAFYGVGAILDLGNDNDTFIAEVMSQAVGGPRGFGLILSQGGRNLYRANGPAPGPWAFSPSNAGGWASSPSYSRAGSPRSAYGTPAVYKAFSQSVGMGVRLYESGGIGVLCDLSGDDRYEGGEFSQGGAYYWALGILYDRAGNDLYYGNRYSQGWAAHQALGILADDDGNDTYWGMTAASQGAAWDQSIALLIDRGGNDSFHADGLSQGAAAQQAIGWLINLDGFNRYIAPRGATQGQSGGNEYHYETSGCFSWSVLLDASGMPNFYSTGRPNDAMLLTGSRNENDPGRSGLHGQFIDLAERMRFWE